MLTPQQILTIVETLYPVIDELNNWIIRDIVKRIMKRMGRGELPYLSESDKWQLMVFQEAGGHLDAVSRYTAQWTNLADEEIRRVFEDAGIKAMEYDNAFYAAHGFGRPESTFSEGMLRLLTDTYQRTAGTVHNFTRTTAQESQKNLIKLLDTAHLRVASGATSYTRAVQDTVKQIASEQTLVHYPTGHVDTIETAVLRAVRTGVAQASGNMAIQGMIERDWDVVLVSAHLGARYGDGGENPGNHFWWQGKFYSRTGATPGLLPFIESTGYGTGEGLSGWNCRHSFGPGDIRHNPYRKFDAEDNKRAYDLSQKQRKMERKIRHQKSELVALREAVDNAEDPSVKAMLEKEYNLSAKSLEAQNLEYNRFCSDNGLRRLDDRIQIAKWTREDAKKSIKTVDKYAEIRYNSDGSIVVTDNWTVLGKTSVPKEYIPNAVVQTMSHGKQMDLTVYDSKGRMALQIHGGDHDNPKQHPFDDGGSHIHTFIWGDDGKASRSVRGFDDDDRIKYAFLRKK